MLPSPYGVLFLFSKSCKKSSKKKISYRPLMGFLFLFSMATTTQVTKGDRLPSPYGVSFFLTRNRWIWKHGGKMVTVPLRGFLFLFSVRKNQSLNQSLNLNQSCRPLTGVLFLFSIYIFIWFLLLYQVTVPLRGFFFCSHKVEES